MKTKEDLRRILYGIDGKGYKAYKEIQGQYSFGEYILSIDYVQGDPFASPSRIRIIMEQEVANFPLEVFHKHHREVAVRDFLTRTLGQNIYKYYNPVEGSGKSGLLSISRCGQEILERSSFIINQKKVEARMEVGLPAAGRRILSKQAEKIFFEALPKIVKNAMYYKNINQKELWSQVYLIEDQMYIREEMRKRKWVAFIANGAILPRKSGISDKPLLDSVISFQSPSSMEESIDLPHKGKIKGMAIPEGITLIVGGGYHGKSTLLNALQRGVYHHILGDGREFVIAREDAVKIRAEDGRFIENVDISPFINHLPNRKDTTFFSTENASGSTSQAANIMEALEISTSLLLIDEDTSATNFMIRDGRMQQLVKKEKEPITPFIDNIQQLYKEKGVSTILVMGGSGDYLEVADHVIMMDEYIPKNVTQRAKDIVSSMPYKREVEEKANFNRNLSRIILKKTFPQGPKGIKIKTRGKHTISYNKLDIDLKYLEQLVDVEQTNSIAMIFSYIEKHLVDGKKSLKEIIDQVYKMIEEKGLDVLSTFKGHPGNLALPRKQEIVAALNRFRYLNIKKQ